MKIKNAAGFALFGTLLTLVWSILYRVNDWLNLVDVSYQITGWVWFLTNFIFYASLIFFFLAVKDTRTKEDVTDIYSLLGIEGNQK